MAILIHVSVVLRRQNRILLVQEEKAENHGRWNLPGGHLELRETLQQGALREVKEETGLQVRLSELVGVYTSIQPPDYHAIRFVFTAEHDGNEPMAGDEILAVQWHSLAEVEALPDSALVGGERLRRILSDVESGVRVPLSLLRDFRQA
jgi:ADP-ribose pyrophosphatase YjhB (NUDIX family)